MLSHLGVWIGFVFLTVGLAFLIGLMSITDFRSINFGKDFCTINGEIKSVSFANYTEFDSRYFEYNFDYSVGGVKYTTSSFDIENDLKVGSVVFVEYKRLDHSIARISGMRMGQSNLCALLFLLIFPVIGLITFLNSLKSVENLIILIRYGLIANGEIINSIERIPKDSEESVTYDKVVKFETNSGETVSATINISEGKKARVGYRADIVYLPWKPQTASFLKGFDKEVIDLIKS